MNLLSSLFFIASESYRRESCIEIRLVIVDENLKSVMKLTLINLRQNVIREKVKNHHNKEFSLATILTWDRHKD